MPYISDKKDREVLDDILYRNFRILIKKGNINYFLFKLAKDSCFYYDDYRKFIGELESSKLEIYRRLVSHYEDEKIETNGDVK